MDNSRKIDFSFIPMPDAISWLMMLLDASDSPDNASGIGWNTKENRIEYVIPGEKTKINEKVKKFIEQRTELEQSLKQVSEKVEAARKALTEGDEV